MGYTTEFQGEFKIDKPVDEDTYKLLVGLNTTRRMKRDPKKLAKRLGKTTEEVIELYGKECDLWVGDTDDFGQEKPQEDNPFGEESNGKYYPVKVLQKVPLKEVTDTQMQIIYLEDQIEQCKKDCPDDVPELEESLKELKAKE